MPGWYAAAQLFIAVVSYVLAPKPKAQKPENAVQREGVDQSLERLYGTRRMSMVITNATTSTRSLSPGVPIADDFGRMNTAIDPLYEPDIASEFVTSEGTGGKTEEQKHDQNTRHGVKTGLYLQGPICVSGRLNGVFSSQLDNLDVKVNELDYDDIVYLAYPGNTSFKIGAGKGGSQGSPNDGERRGNAHALFLSGNRRDGYAEAVGFGSPGDEWTNCVHATTFAWQRLTATSGDSRVYNGIPEWSFVLKSNELWDPRVDADGAVNNPISWQGPIDNPALQLLDYLLDKDFGVGVALSEIDKDSFILMASICDVPISTTKALTTINETQGITATNNIFNLNDEAKVRSLLALYGNTPDEIDDIMERYQTSYNAYTQERTEVRQVMESNITLDTSDALNSNIEQLLAALRGARLFKNNQGKWKVAPAWLVDEDITQVITGETGVGPFRQNFAVGLADIVVKVDGTPITVTQQNLEDDSGDLQTILISYKNANYDSSATELVINFKEGDIPDSDITRKYVLIDAKIGEASKVTFIPVVGNPSVDNNPGTSTYRWTVTTGVYGTKPNRDINYNGATSSFKAYLALPEFVPGIILEAGDALTGAEELTIEYPTVPGVPIAAHIISDAMNLGLDYDAIYDNGGIEPIRVWNAYVTYQVNDVVFYASNSTHYQTSSISLGEIPGAAGTWSVYVPAVAGPNLPLIQIIDLSKSSYSSVSLDDKLNQFTVKYSDEFQLYKKNEVTWPDVNAPTLMTIWKVDVQYAIDDIVLYTVDGLYYQTNAASIGQIPPDTPAKWTVYEPNIYSKMLLEDNNKPLSQEVDINSITSRAHAIDYAEFQVRKSRSQNSVTYNLATTAFMLEPNDLVKVTDSFLNLEDTGFSNRYWIVSEKRITSNSTVDVTLVQYETEDYTFISEDYSDDKFVAELAPLPTVTFLDPCFKKFPLGSSAGSGRLQWVAPDFGSVSGYIVKLSNLRSWFSGATYEIGAVVWYDEQAWRATTVTTGAVPGATDDWDYSDQDRWTQLGGTDTTSMVVFDLDVNKQYLFSVQVVVPTRGIGPPSYCSFNYIHTVAPPGEFKWSSDTESLKIEWQRMAYTQDITSGCLKAEPIPPDGAAFRVYMRPLGYFLDIARIGDERSSITDWASVTIPFGESTAEYWEYDPTYAGGDPEDISSYRIKEITPENFQEVARNYETYVNLGLLIPPTKAYKNIQDLGTTGTNSFVISGLKKGYAFQIWVREILPYDPTVYSLPGPLGGVLPTWCLPSTLEQCTAYDCSAYLNRVSQLANLVGVFDEYSAGVISQEIIDTFTWTAPTDPITPEVIYTETTFPSRSHFEYLGVHDSDIFVNRGVDRVAEPDLFYNLSSTTRGTIWQTSSNALIAKAPGGGGYPGEHYANALREPGKPHYIPDNALGGKWTVTLSIYNTAPGWIPHAQAAIFATTVDGTSWNINEYMLHNGNLTQSTALAYDSVGSHIVTFGTAYSQFLPNGGSPQIVRYNDISINVNTAPAALSGDYTPNMTIGSAPAVTMTVDVLNAPIGSNSRYVVSEALDSSLDRMVYWIIPSQPDLSSSTPSTLYFRGQETGTFFGFVNVAEGWLETSKSATNGIDTVIYAAASSSTRVLRLAADTVPPQIFTPIATEDSYYPVLTGSTGGIKSVVYGENIGYVVFQTTASGFKSFYSTDNAVTFTEGPLINYPSGGNSLNATAKYHNNFYHAGDDWFVGYYASTTNSDRPIIFRFQYGLLEAPGGTGPDVLTYQAPNLIGSPDYFTNIITTTPTETLPVVVSNEDAIFAANTDGFGNCLPAAGDCLKWLPTVVDDTVTSIWESSVAGGTSTGSLIDAMSAYHGLVLVKGDLIFQNRLDGDTYGNSTLERSNDFGATWAEVSTPLDTIHRDADTIIYDNEIIPRAEFRTLRFDSEGSLYALWGYWNSGTAGALFKSVDGVNWTLQHTNWLGPQDINDSQFEFQGVHEFTHTFNIEPLTDRVIRTGRMTSLMNVAFQFTGKLNNTRPVLANSGNPETGSVAQIGAGTGTGCAVLLNGWIIHSTGAANSYIWTSREDMGGAYINSIYWDGGLGQWRATPLAGTWRTGTFNVDAVNGWTVSLGIESAEPNMWENSDTAVLIPVQNFDTYGHANMGHYYWITAGGESPVNGIVDWSGELVAEDPEDSTLNSFRVFYVKETDRWVMTYTFDTTPINSLTRWAYFKVASSIDGMPGEWSIAVKVNMPTNYLIWGTTSGEMAIDYSTTRSKWLISTYIKDTSNTTYRQILTEFDDSFVCETG